MDSDDETTEQDGAAVGRTGRKVGRGQVYAFPSLTAVRSSVCLRLNFFKQSPCIACLQGAYALPGVAQPAR